MGVAVEMLRHAECCKAPLAHKQTLIECISITCIRLIA
jgi:hypothetical protein